MNNINIDVNCKTFEQEKSWQLCVGGGHGSLTLRQDYREQLKYVHDELGFKYLRFHGIFCDDMKVITPLSQMIPLPGAKEVKTVSFFQIANTFDYLLEIGMKPFVELSFMPSVLASKNKTLFFYGANISLPKIIENWNGLIREFIEFLVDRYGKSEVESWYFEVWNEPDLKNFFLGTQQDYFDFYANTVNTIKAVNENIKVGGPATSGNKWLLDFQNYCTKHNVPFDFLSTHHYPGPPLGHSVKFGIKQIKSIIDLVKAHKGKSLNEFFSKMSDKTLMLADTPRGKLTKELQKAREEAGKHPLIYTEWNSNSGCGYSVNDETYTSAFIIKTIMDNKNLADGYAFWTFSDIFEELSFFPEPFSGSFGMLNNQGIEKPSFWAFKLLSMLSNHRLDTAPTVPDSETLEYAVFRNNANYQVLLYNMQMPTMPIKKEKGSITINIAAKSIGSYTIDESSGNPKSIWEKDGKKKYLKRQEVKDIRNKSKVYKQNVEFTLRDGKTHIEYEIGENAVILFEIEGV